MDEKNKDLPLIVAEILIEMQQMRQEIREDRRFNQQRHEEMIQVFNRSFELVIDKLGEIKTEVKELKSETKELRTTVEKIDKRVANIEESLTGEYERRLRVLEEIVLKKAS